MTIDKVILYNYGPFSGKHEIDLSLRDKERNIILIGGLNGSGKTSILNAIQLGFFGKLALKKVKGSGSYKTIVKDNFNSKTKDRNTYIEIHFQAEYMDKKQSFLLSRTWRETKNGFSENFSVMNGVENLVLNNKLSNHWEDHVDQFFPFNISDLFLFDGEKIEHMASHENSNEYIRSSIKSLFGLDILDSTISDLNILEKRIYDEIDEIINDPKFHNALFQLKSTESDLESRLKEKNEIQRRLVEIQNVLYIQKQNLKTVGGDLYNQKEFLIDELRVLEKEKIDAISDISVLMNGRLPFLFTKTLLHEIYQDGKNNYSRAEIELLEDKLTAQEKQVLKILEETGTDAPTLQKITDKIKTNTDLYSFPEFKLISDRSGSYDARKLLENSNDVWDEYERKSSKFKEIDEKIFEINNRLSSIPSSEKITPELDKLNLLYDEEQAYSIKLNYIDEQIEYLKKECKQLNDQVLMFSYDDSSDGKSSLILKRRIVQKIESIKPVISNFDNDMINRRINKIENLTLDSINQLMRKENFIKDFSINPDTFELCIVNTFNEFVNLDQLSAGERQIIATSLLWGMAKASKQMLPLIIDTPLGRLDSYHRTNLIKYYFPDGSHQVVLLSTDQEISGIYYNKLKSHIAREYTIKYNPELASSEIIEGYPFMELNYENA